LALKVNAKFDRVLHSIPDVYYSVLSMLLTGTFFYTQKDAA